MPRRARPLLALAVALALAAAPARAAAEGELRLEGELGGGLDTNPRRILGAPATGDGFLLALLKVRGTVSGDRAAAALTLAEAGRLYLSIGEATAGASRLDLQARYAVADRLSIGLDASASDLTERGHLLDQDAVRATGWVSWRGDGWGALARGGWALFAPRSAPLRPFEASGPEAGARLDWSPARDHVLSAGYDLWATTFPRWGELAGATRDDRTQTASAEWAYRGAFVAALGYAFTWNRSTATGGDFDRHRVSARAAAFLPWEITAAARGVLQWASYPQPLFVPQQLLLAEGQENLDSLELRLTRPIAGPVEVALSAAVYHAEAPALVGPALTLDRAVVSASLAWRGGWEFP